MTLLKKHPWTSKLRSLLTKCWPKTPKLIFNSKTKKLKNNI